TVRYISNPKSLQYKIDGGVVLRLDVGCYYFRKVRVDGDTNITSSVDSYEY
ncbi:MAG: hypothetical protein GY861_10660, partial [bacterium]|nr:hypothetical protein [bacterium]